MTDVNEEDIHCWLGWPNHVLGWSNKLHSGMIQLFTSPSIAGLVANLIPIKELRHLVRHVAHTAPPT